MRCRALLVACLAVALLGCSAQSAPDLLRVEGLAPKTIENGDRLELRGGSFPEGRAASVVFRGSLLRPGQRPLEDIEIAARGTSTSDERLVVPVDRDLERRFCGRGRHAVHTTFVGQLVVTFEGHGASEAQVSGRSAEVVLDVVPTDAPPDRVASRDELGARAAAHLGLALERAVTAAGAATTTTPREFTPTAAADAIEPGGPLEPQGPIAPNGPAATAEEPTALPESPSAEHAAASLGTSTSPAQRPSRPSVEGVPLRLPDQEAATALTVSSVAPGSAADHAGLRSGDAILSVDGLTARTLYDLYPAPGVITATLLVRRPGTEVPTTTTLDLDGVRPALPDRLAPAAALVLAAAFFMLGWLGPAASLARWWEHRLGAHLKRRRRLGQRTPTGLLGLVADLVPSPSVEPAFSRLSWRVGRLAIAASVATVFALASFHRALVSRDLDGAVVLLAATTAWLVASLVAGGTRTKGSHWSALAGLRAVAEALLWLAPVPVALASAVVVTGCWSLRELVAAQGAAPWRWLAFEDPGALVLCGLMLATTLAAHGTSSEEMPDAERDQRVAAGPPRRRRGGLIVDLGQWCFALVIASLIVVVFLGGWKLPGVTLDEQAARRGLQVLGALLFQVKVAAVTGLALVLRQIVPRLEPRQLVGLSLRRLLPLAGLAAALSLAWQRVPESLPWTVLRESASGALLLAALGACAVALLLAARTLRHPAPQASVNPWL